MILVLPSFSTAYKMAAVLLTGPIKRSDPEHHPLDDCHRPQMLLLCNGSFFPDVDQSPPVLPGPFHQSPPFPPSQGGDFPQREFIRRETAIPRKVYLKFDD